MCDRPYINKGKIFLELEPKDFIYNKKIDTTTKTLKTTTATTTNANNELNFTNFNWQKVKKIKKNNQIIN